MARKVGMDNLVRCEAFVSQISSGGAVLNLRGGYGGYVSAQTYCADSIVECAALYQNGGHTIFAAFASDGHRRDFENDHPELKQVWLG